MTRAYYAESIAAFLAGTLADIRDRLAGQAAQEGFPPLQTQLEAWSVEIEILQRVLVGYEGSIYFEYSIPRMGRRIDVVLLIGPVVFVLEFKVGEGTFTRNAEDQVWDYALDLKNFHETSHQPYVAPILIATVATRPGSDVIPPSHEDRLFPTLKASPGSLNDVIEGVLKSAGEGSIERTVWEAGRYRPTPTIIEAALALYSRHSVIEISRSDAGAMNLTTTTQTITEIILKAKEKSRKTICFITGVPGAGKTLVGLNVATRYMSKSDDLYSVFLSGNGPLVKILCEALARDQVRRAREDGKYVRIGKARSEVKAFIQNVHHFRDECLHDEGPPVEHVALFDEAQRAWDKKETVSFMKRKKNRPDFHMSEPEYLISCLDRHRDWAVVICLVGEGQEINRGEAGIGEWIASLNRSFPQWEMYVSPRLTDEGGETGGIRDSLRTRQGVTYRPELHLATSMRSFRAEHVSLLVNQLLDLDVAGARNSLGATSQYPIRLTRKVETAKQWLRANARGSERYGIVVSSQAERLRPHAISVRSPVDPVHWFLDGKEDVRSSYYLEDVATEFDIQGLELDWSCVTWDADLRYSRQGWKHWSFRGDRWNHILKADRKRYLTNAYRVLLTRARQGMVIVVPEGDPEDPTRDAAFYDPTFVYLQEIGLHVI